VRLPPYCYLEESHAQPSLCVWAAALPHAKRTHVSGTPSRLKAAYILSLRAIMSVPNTRKPIMNPAKMSTLMK